MPITANAQRWDWPPAMQGTDPVNHLSAPGALFLEAANFPDFSFSPPPVDRSTSLQSAQRRGSFEAPPVQANSESLSP